MKALLLIFTGIAVFLGVASPSFAQTPLRVSYETGAAEWTQSGLDGNVVVRVSPSSGEFFVPVDSTSNGFSLSGGTTVKFLAGQLSLEMSGLSTTVGSLFTTTTTPLERSLTLRLNDGTTYSGMQALGTLPIRSEVYRFRTLSTPFVGDFRRSSSSYAQQTEAAQPITLGDYEFQFILDPVTAELRDEKRIRISTPNNPLEPDADKATLRSSLDLTVRAAPRNPSAIPEPCTLLLSLLGICCLTHHSKRRK
jgi:hypothetical protein